MGSKSVGRPTLGALEHNMKLAIRQVKARLASINEYRDLLGMEPQTLDDYINEEG